MDINKIKQVMKEKKITQLQLSKITGIPLQTIKCILIGRTKFPRIDTVDAIEKALGLNKTPTENFTLSNIEKEIIKNYNQLETNRKIIVVEILQNLR